MKSPGLLVKDRNVLDWEGDVGDVGVPPPHPIINPDRDRMATVVTT
jgi:hypothetical protein